MLTFASTPFISLSKFMKRIVHLIALFNLLICAGASAQTLKGRVLDANTGEALFSAVVQEKGTGNGTLTDFDGEFSLKLNSLPTTLTIGLIGYKEQEIAITATDKKIEIKLSTSESDTLRVDIVSDRILQKQKQNPLSVETMDALAIKEVPTGNFYEGLAALKGVDMASASLAFRVINTRGFNSTSPVRILQLIDGVDNQSPGLNFSLGNFLGAPDLDVKSVEIVQGASSSFYGPGAFNGVIKMETKNPFFTPGLSFSMKLGERGLVQPSLRWADVVNNKDSLPVFAYKLNLLYLTAEDWHADNYKPIYGSKNDEKNYGGYDAVNIYGDEYFAAFDYSTSSAYSGSYRGLGTFYRKGYKEEDLVDYNTSNLKASASFHLRLKPELDYNSPELIYQINTGKGSTMYQGDNRFRLQDIFFMQNRLELTKKDKYFIRLYSTQEDAGKTYDPYFTALRMRDEARTQEDWASVYIKYWQNKVIPKMNANGYPGLVQNPNWPGPIADPDYSEYFLPYDYDSLNNWYNNYSDSMFVWHQWVQDLSNTGNAGIPNIDSMGYYVPGTDQFNTSFNRIISQKNNEGQGGTRFFDRSKLYHLQSEYKWSLVKIDEVRVGGNARLYTPNSDGTIFLDGRQPQVNSEGDTTYVDTKITNFEFGLYAGIEKKLAEDKIIINATCRLDKNQNFKDINSTAFSPARPFYTWAKSKFSALLSPAISAVFIPKKDHYLRLSLSSALRNPTLADQYLSLNVGPATLRGNLNGVDSLITLESFTNFRDTQNPDTIRYFNIAPIKPEQARTIEVGYRASIKNKVYLDMSVYNTWYNNFIGYKLGIDADFDTSGNLYYGSIKAYRYSANSENTVITRGANIGASWYFYKEHTFTFNYSYNKLVKTDANDRIIPAFNTPLHKFNVGFSGRDLFKAANGNTWGYGFNYKWVDNYFWEGSPQFTGPVPKFDVLDGQVNYTLVKQNINVKVGCSNLFSNKHIEAYGGPMIGRLAYITLLYEWKKN